MYYTQVYTYTEIYVYISYIYLRGINSGIAAEIDIGDLEGANRGEGEEEEGKEKEVEKEL